MSDNVHHAGAGRYQAFAQEAELVADDSTGDATRVPQNPRVPEYRAASSPAHDDLHSNVPNGANGPTWGREGVRRPEGSEQIRPRAEQSFPRDIPTGEVAREGYGDAPIGGAAQDDEETRQWEEDDHRNWPGQERDGWGGQSARWNSGNLGARQGSGQRRLTGVGGRGGVGGGGDALAGRRSAGRGTGGESRDASARGTRSPLPPPPPPPPLPPTMGAAALGGGALHQNGGAAARREQFEEGRQQEEDEFGDGQAWGEVDATDDRASGAPFKRSNSAGSQQRLPGGGRGKASEPWPRPPHQDSAASVGKALQGAPPQSKLVQRVFGRRGRGGSRGRGGAGRGGRGGGARDGEGTQEDERERGDGAESWALQAELQGKLQELEEEV